MVKFEIPKQPFPSREFMIMAIGREEGGRAWFHLYGPRGTGSGGSDKYSPPPECELMKAKDLFDALARLDDDALCKRWSDVEAVIQRRYDEKAEAEEVGRFFNRPEARADFAHWAKAAHWSPDELVALSLGRSPETVSAKRVESYSSSSPFAKEYLRRHDLVIRAIKMKQLSYNAVPTFALAWCKRVNIEVDERLYSAVEALGLQVADWKAAYDLLKQKFDYQEQELLDLRERVDGNKHTQGGSESAETRRRNTLLKVIAGIAVDAYGWRPGIRGRTAGDILRATESIGMRVSEDTVRSVLSDAAEYIVTLPEGD